MHERSYGYKYGETDSDAAEIARRMRSDIRQAQEEGLLPIGSPTYSVTIDRFSMGQSIDIEVRDWPSAWKPCDRMPCTNVWCSFGGEYRDNPASSPHDILTDMAEAAKLTLECIHGAFNHDGSDIMTDYFDVRYYGHVRFEDARSAEFRAEEKARKEARHAALDTATDRRRVKIHKRQGAPVVHLAAEIDGKLRLLCGAVASRYSFKEFTEAEITCSRCARREASR